MLREWFIEHQKDLQQCATSEDYDPMVLQIELKQERRRQHKLSLRSKTFETPIPDWSERFWLRDFLEAAIDRLEHEQHNVKMMVERPDLSDDYRSFQVGTLEELEVAREILMMLDQYTPTLILRGDQMLHLGKFCGIEVSIGVKTPSMRNRRDIAIYLTKILSIS